MWYAEDLVPITLDDIKEAAEKCSAWKVFMHWSAGRYGQVWEDYHINIDSDGSLYCVGDLDFDERKSHTWKQNTGAIGISMCACYGATVSFDEEGNPVIDYGDYAPTKEQIEAMALIMAILYKHGHIQYEHMKTHYEIACEMGYGVPYGEYVNGIYQGDSDCRWDLMKLPDSAANGELRNGGDVLRGKAIFYENYV